MKAAEFLETSRAMTKMIQAKLDNYASEQVHIIMLELLRMCTQLHAMILFSRDVMYIQYNIFCYQDSNHREEAWREKKKKK